MAGGQEAGWETVTVGWVISVPGRLGEWVVSAELGG